MNYNTQDEQLFQSVSNLMAGDMDSYYAMYDLSIKYIYKIIYDIVKDYHTTEDLVQETYITIYNKINTLQDPRKFYSWAGRIATNHTLRYIQTNRRELLVFDAEDGASDFIFDLASQDNEEFIPENILMDLEKQRIIAEIIDGLSVEQKLAIQYFYYEELSVREIAELMGCSEGTIKSRLNYARKAIKEAIIDLDVNEDTRLYSLSTLPIFFIIFKTAVDHFTFAGTVASGVEMAGAVGEGVASGSAGVVGEGVASGSAGAVGEGISQGSVGVIENGVTSGTTTGTSAGGTVASGLGKGIFAKLGTSIGAKIAAGVITAGLIVTGGIAIHNLITDNNEETTTVTTEEIAEATPVDASDVDTATFTDVTTEEPEEDYEADNQLINDFYMEALNKIYYDGTLPAPDDMGNNQLWEQDKEGDYYSKVEYAIFDVNNDNYNELVVRTTDRAFVYKYDLETETCTEIFRYMSASPLNIEGYHYYDNGVIYLDYDGEIGFFVFDSENTEYRNRFYASTYHVYNQMYESEDAFEQLIQQYDVNGDGCIFSVSAEGEEHHYGDMDEVDNAKEQYLSGATEIIVEYAYITPTVNVDSGKASSVYMTAKNIDLNATDPIN